MAALASRGEVESGGGASWTSAAARGKKGEGDFPSRQRLARDVDRSASGRETYIYIGLASAEADAWKNICRFDRYADLLGVFF
jgi:hypothetical protein